MFGEQVTPNRHKLANEFVLLDNLYCNGHVSRDGHPWSTMAYNTDYIARDWSLTYSQRKGVDDDEGGRLINAPAGHIWDAAARAGVQLPQLRRRRPAGQHRRRPGPHRGVEPRPRRPHLPGLRRQEKGAKVRDTDRIDVFLKEYHEFEKAGTMPRLITMSLPEDHTTGTTPLDVHPAGVRRVQRPGPRPAGRGGQP